MVSRSLLLDRKPSDPVIDAVLFDAFGTLFSPVSAGSPPAHLSRLLASDGVRIPIDRATKAIIAEVELFRTKSPHIRTEEEMRLLEYEATDLVLTELELASFPRDRMRQHLLDLFTPTAYPDAEPTLRRLQQMELTLGVVSNYNSLLTAHLAQLGLADWFRVIVNSADFGRPKPYAGIFHEAIKRLRVAPDRALYVGDDLRNDYYGAQEAGLHAVWLNRDYAPAAEGVAAIATLAELPQFLQRDCSSSPGI